MRARPSYTRLTHLEEGIVATDGQSIARDDDVLIFGHDHGEGFTIVIVDRKRLSAAVLSTAFLTRADLDRDIAEKVPAHAAAVRRWIEER